MSFSSIAPEPHLAEDLNSSSFSSHHLPSLGWCEHSNPRPPPVWRDVIAELTSQSSSLWSIIWRAGAPPSWWWGHCSGRPPPQAGSDDVEPPGDEGIATHALLAQRTPWTTHCPDRAGPSSLPPLLEHNMPLCSHCKSSVTSSLTCIDISASLMVTKASILASISFSF